MECGFCHTKTPGQPKVCPKCGTAGSVGSNSHTSRYRMHQVTPSYNCNKCGYSMVPTKEGLMCPQCDRNRRINQ